MKIIFQHNGVLPVVGYGGIERILFWHMKELARRGHDVVLIGDPKSQVEKYGIKLIPNPADEDWIKVVPNDTDLIHITYNHPPETEIPVLVNIHGNGQIGETFPKNTVFVSKKHAAVHGSDQYVHNGLDFSEYPKVEPKEFKGIESLLFLAKASWKVKNLKQSIQIAKETKKSLHIAGGKSYWPSRYIQSHGMVGGEKKYSIMKSCDALIFPVRWHEPFGIAIIEAMYFGLPVLGSQYGSLPELINEDVGQTFQNKKDIIEFINGQSAHFNGRDIQNYVLNNFAIENVTSNYLKVYERILDGEQLNKSSPQWCEPKAPLDLLDF